ncbi:DNA adenine methylase [Treponema putidum]|uniref:DNA adenine methylase n=1 Tax=Treponema putidum TaxID=221027 RepID=UPI003D911324
MTTTKINNRRYLGNKYKLLPFITDVISSECGNFNSFAGTGAVSSAYADKNQK